MEFKFGFQVEAQRWCLCASDALLNLEVFCLYFWWFYLISLKRYKPVVRKCSLLENITGKVAWTCNFTRKTPIQVFSCKFCKILHDNVIRKMVGTEAVARRWFVKKVFINIFQNSQGNTCVGASIWLKLQALGLKLYSKRDTDTCVLWILRNF